MEKRMKLFMVLVGCKPTGRHTEQHDVFFGVGETIEDTFDDIQRFWPEAIGAGIHIDAYREVAFIETLDCFRIEVIHRDKVEYQNDLNLFFLNLGGYREGVFEEFHQKNLFVAPGYEAAKKLARKQKFYQENHNPHVDDRYGLDIDDLANVKDILPKRFKDKYAIVIIPTLLGHVPDKITLGYNFVDLKKKA